MLSYEANQPFRLRLYPALSTNLIPWQESPTSAHSTYKHVLEQHKICASYLTLEISSYEAKQPFGLCLYPALNMISTLEPVAPMICHKDDHQPD